MSDSISYNLRKRNKLNDIKYKTIISDGGSDDDDDDYEYESESDISESNSSEVLSEVIPHHKRQLKKHGSTPNTPLEHYQMNEYRKFLRNMFPSEYLNQKIRKYESHTSNLYNGSSSNKKMSNEKVKNISKHDIFNVAHMRDLDDDNESECDEDDEVDNDEEEEEEEEEEDDDDDEGDDEDEDYEGDMQPINVILNIKIPNMNDGSEYDDEEEDESDELVEEDESDELVEEEEDEVEEEEEETSHLVNHKKDLVITGKRMNGKSSDNIVSKSKGKSLKSKSSSLSSYPALDSILSEHSCDELKELIVHMKTKETYDISGNTLNKKQHKLIQAYEDVLDKRLQKENKVKEKKEKKEKKDVCKEFKKLLKEDKNLNDFSYFKKLELPQQKILIDSFKLMKDNTNILTPYRIKLIQSDIPDEFKSIALAKINTLRHMDPCSGEYYKIKHWVDNFMMIPFGKYNKLSMTLDMGVDKCSEFMLKSKNILDEAVYGLNDAKMQIMQMMAQWISNPSAIGTAIAIKGPMGTGKTTLVKEGISKILGRPFAFIALGGATDSAFLEGHSYTYEGSTWGHIVEVLKQSKCMNPVFYFDELDKVSDTSKGDEIIGILTHLTDTTQNSQFHDKYFSGIDLDLSKALYIFSYNDENKINPILRDRMYKIQTEGYNQKEKKIIAKKYIIPSIERNIGFKSNDVELNDDVISYVIEQYASSEKGVRNLKRCLEIICTKLNLYRIMKPDTLLYDKEKTLDVQFPYKVTREVIMKLLKKDKNAEWMINMYT